MSFYSAPFSFDFDACRIDVDPGVTALDCGLLYEMIKQAQASEAGVIHDRIAIGSGRNALGSGVRTALTLELLPPWRLRFPAGNYSATISGGNLIGGPNGDPLDDCPGVTIVVIQSAAATIVSGATGASAATEIADAVWRAALPAQVAGNTTGAALKQARDNAILIPALL